MPRRWFLLTHVPTSFVAVLVLMNAAAAGTFHIVHAFNAADGAGVHDVVFDEAGNLYGTSAAGGSGGCRCGSVFELTPSGQGRWTETILYSFTNDNGDGRVPNSGVVFDRSGNLYGETLYGGTYGQGAVYRLGPNATGGWTEDILYSFPGKTAGSDPSGGLVFDTAGNLYGVADVRNGGIAFELLPNPDGTWNFQVIYQFLGGNDGANPVGIRTGPGNVLYGATMSGGGSGCFSQGCGTVFMLAPNSSGSWTETVLYRFSGGSDGSQPISGVTLDSAGNIYGTTGFGGYVCPDEGAGCGVVYKLSRQTDGTWRGKVLHTFGHGNDGMQPWGPVSLDLQGNLYGTTFFGGTFGEGTVFGLSKDSSGRWNEKPLHAFTSAADGYSPRERLEFDHSGNLYSSSTGGATGFDLVFEITP